MWLMPRAFIDGRGGDGGVVMRNRTSFMVKELPKEELERRVKERMMDPAIKNYPTYDQILKYPQFSPIWFDFIMNPCDGPFYSEGKASRRFEKIKIPAHFGAQWGRGWVVDGTINGFLEVKGPKKLVLRSAPPMQERPFHQFHDEIVRWYDHWLKGIDTGIMDEPPIKIFLHGVNEWRYEHEWPLARTKWTKFYLRSRHRLLTEPEPFDADSVPPDGFYQAPLTVTNNVLSVSYRIPSLLEDTEVTGPCALYLYATIDTDDTQWIVRIFDVDPQGNKFQLTTGWLKASHNELDESKSKPWAPHHPHTRSVPIKIGEMNKYAIKVFPMSNVFKKGHSIELEIRSIETAGDVDPGMPPESGHLDSGRATTHKIYRDKNHQSYLLLPIIPRV
jgi:predicted acyl esterase